MSRRHHDGGLEAVQLHRGFESHLLRQPARRAALVGQASATSLLTLQHCGSKIVHTSRPIQANYARSLIAAVTANSAARVMNIHPDNVGRSLTTVSAPDAAAPGGASLEVTCDVVLTCAPMAAPRTLRVIVQDWPAASTFDVLERVSAPGLMLKMPPPVASVLHVPPVWVMRSIPAGMVSLN